MSETAPAKRLYIKTYGCQMNVYDSERMADVLAPLGYGMTDDPAAADLVVLGVMVFCYNRFLAIAFNAELARLRGVSTGCYEVIYYVMTALTVVLLVRVAGIVLAVALLTLPAAAAGLLTRRLDRMMALAVGIGAGVSLLGLALSYGPGWPPGATIVELAIIAYLAVAVGKKLYPRA